MSVSNRHIAKLFKLTGKLLELHAENPFKSKAYESASRNVRSIAVRLSEVPEEELENISGIGKTLAKNIVQIRETGSFEMLDSLMQLTPPGLLELAQIRKLGVKKVRQLWEELSITSPEELLEACKQHKLQALRGFGKKNEEKIIELIHFYFESKGKWLYAEAEFDANVILSYLQSRLEVARVSFTGDLRRKTEIVNRLEFLIGLQNGSTLETILDEKADEFIAVIDGRYSSPNLEIPVIFHVANADEWDKKLFITTGNEEHLKLLNAGTYSSNNEKEIYSANSLPFIIPEMREGRDELEIAEKITEEEIIQFEDLKGCLHNHSLYSDGSNSIEQMARACIDRGYQYFGLCDHSKSATYAKGMQVKRVLDQWKEVDKLNEKLKPFRIFKGIESDILRNGGLDYEDDILKQFDFVVGSVHSQLDMKEPEATARLLKAIENPHLNILGHMTARLLLMRRGFEVNYKKIIDACVENNVVIELNANPRRLDMDWRWISYAWQKGVLISINPDAHDTDEIGNMYYGVCVARKAGLPKKMVLNAKTLDEIVDIFSTKKKAVA